MWPAFAATAGLPVIELTGGERRSRSDDLLAIPADVRQKNLNRR